MTLIVGQDFNEIGRITLTEGELSYAGDVEEVKAAAEYFKAQYKWSNEELIQNLPLKMNSRVWCKPAA